MIMVYLIAAAIVGALILALTYPIIIVALLIVSAIIAFIQERNHG